LSPLAFYSLRCIALKRDLATPLVLSDKVDCRSCLSVSFDAHRFHVMTNANRLIFIEI